MLGQLSLPGQAGWYNLDLKYAWVVVLVNLKYVYIDILVG